MGQYLSSPVTKKETYSKELPHLHVGISSQQGWRKTQEDSHVAVDIDNNTMLFGVFDGHGGGEVAKFSSKHIPVELKTLNEFRKGDFKESLVGVFHRIDDMLRSPEGLEELRTLRQDSQGPVENEDRSFDLLQSFVLAQRNLAKAYELDDLPAEEVQAGCTAVVALLHKNMLYVANAGDSRAVLCRSGKAIALSEDHKPSQATERERIVAAGGYLSEIGGMCRVNGNLNLSRAIGDLKYKSNKDLHPSAQIITAQPDITETKLDKGDDFIVLACDGIWDVMTNQQVVDFVSEGLQDGKSCQDICSDILDACLAKDPRENRGIGCDNMTCCVVKFLDNFFLQE